MRLVLAVFSIGLALGASPAFSQDVSPARSDAERQMIAQGIPRAVALLRADLLDYDNTRFMDVKVTIFRPVNGAPSSAVFCGKLNAPNAMGGMTGWRPFGVDATQGKFYTGSMAILLGCSEAEGRFDPTDYTPRFSPPK